MVLGGVALLSSKMLIFASISVARNVDIVMPAVVSKKSILPSQLHVPIAPAHYPKAQALADLASYDSD